MQAFNSSFRLAKTSNSEDLANCEQPAMANKFSSQMFGVLDAPQNEVNKVVHNLLVVELQVAIDYFAHDFRGEIMTAQVLLD